MNFLSALNNEYLWVLMLILNFGTILIVYRFFGRVGLFSWIPVSIIVANIQVLKTVELFGITSSLGNIFYATSFLATDILSENHGKKDAQRAVGIGFLTIFLFTAGMNLALAFDATDSDFAHESMNTLFNLLPRIAVASFIAYLVSQFNDVLIYSNLKRANPDSKLIWLRNNVSTMLSQALDSIFFVSIAFAWVVSWNDFRQILLSTYILKFVVAILDTPLVYLASSWWRKGLIKE